MQIGGRDGLLKMTEAFYQLSFKDPVIDRFIRDHTDPHARRFANWLAEKMGDHSRPWSDDRAHRSRNPVHLGNGRTVVIHDRSSAHAAAWYSPKRNDREMGRHFQLHECRIWMRLHFTAAEQTKLFEVSQFKEWYIRFIGHFVAVYENKARMFARESARWAANASNFIPDETLYVQRVTSYFVL